MVVQSTVHSLSVSNISFVPRVHSVPHHCIVSSHVAASSACHPTDNLKINGACVCCQPCQRHLELNNTAYRNLVYNAGYIVQSYSIRSMYILSDTYNLWTGFDSIVIESLIVLLDCVSSNVGTRALCLPHTLF